MAEELKTDFDLLHAVRVKGKLMDEAIPPEASKRLRELEGEGCVMGSPAGYVLTEDGLRRQEEMLAREREELDLDALSVAYDRFLALNDKVKALCARWQELDPGDELTRLELLEELEGLHERVEASLRRAARGVPRFGSYLERLTAALEGARAGEDRRITDPAVDSYHSIWFECHEDYLLTLGRDRESEGS